MKNRKFCKLSALVLAAAMVFAMLPVSALAGFSDWFSAWTGVDEQSATVQATSATVAQPFTSGNEGSTHFRIPAIVTLNDGTIVAAADARWNSASDSGGIDTLVAVSEDSGNSWSYVWANYLGYNKDTKSQDKSYGTFIDPSLATDGDTVYMLVDLFPRGNSNLNTGLTGDAFVNGHMRLSQGNVGNDEDSYTYYLGDFNYTDYAQIFDASDNTVDGYTVDRWFNLYYNGSAAGNLFYENADYQAYPINYLYLTKSTDGGNTWSAPTLIDLKENGEIFYGACPGGGYVTSTGRIIFPCYSADTIGTGYLQTSVIYSDDGVNWTRSADMGDVGYTSESTVSEVKLGDTDYLYLFTRSNKTSSKVYYVSSDNGETWEKGGDLSISYGTSSSLGSMTYSKLIDGCPAIIFSAPATTSHESGVIYVGLVQSDGTIDFKYTKSVTSSEGYFKYSDLAELEDGRVALLYESAWTTKSAAAEITFEVFDIADLCPSGKITVEDEENGISVTARGLTSVTVYDVKVTYNNDTVGSALNKTVTGVVAYDITPATASDDYQGSATIKIPVDEEWDSERVGAFTVEDGMVEDLGQVSVEDGYAIINAKHFSVYGAYALGEDETFDEVVIAADKTIQLKVGEKATERISGSNYENDVDKTNLKETIATVDVVGTDASKTDPVYTSVSVAYSTLAGSNTSWTKTSYYYKSDNNYYPVYAYRAKASGKNYTYYYGYSTDGGSNVTTLGSSSKGSSWVSETLYQMTSAGTDIPASTTITFTGVAPGTTYVTVGETTYKIIVAHGEHTVYVQPNNAITLDTKYGTTIVENPKNTSVATAKESNDSIVITAGTVEGTTTMKTEKYIITIVVADVVTDITTENSPFVGGTENVYNGSSSDDPKTDGAKISHEKPITKITITAGLTYDVDLADGTEAVSWKTGDETIATVDDEGRVTAVSEGNTTLTASLTDGTTYQIPVVVLDGTYESQDTYRVWHFYMEKVLNTTVYYSYNFNSLIETAQGEVFYAAFPKVDDYSDHPISFDFFGKPDEGYALTGLASGLAAGSYYPIHENGVLNTESSDYFYMGIRGNKTEGNIVDYLDEFKKELEDAVEKGCDGAQGFTDYYNGADGKGTESYKTNIAGFLSFYSQKLPTIEKTVEGIYDGNGDRKTGDNANKVGIGDTVKFTITVKQYAISEYGDITYSNVTVTDGQPVTGFNQTDFSFTTSEAEPFEKTGVVSLTLTEENFATVVKDGEITNEVKLEYAYIGGKNKFSQGTATASASASAKVTVSVPTYVVDFGLPVTVNLQTIVSSMGYDITSVEGNGATNNGYEITYTPDSVLTKPAYIMLNLQKITDNAKTTQYGVFILPASNVLYEENFLTAADGDTAWTLTENTLGAQAAEIAGSENIHGYDSAYATSTTANGYYEATGLNTSTMTAALTTTFTGTGFDLIGNCGPNTGRVMVILMNQSDKTKSKVAIVDTRYNGNDGDDDGILYQVPLAHLMVDYGTYNVSIYASGTDAMNNANTASAVSTYSLNRTSVASVDPFEQYLEENNITDVEYIVMSDTLTASAQSVSAISTYAAEETTTTIPAGAHVEIDAFRVYYPTDNKSYTENEQNVQYVNILDAVEGNITAWTETNGELTIDVDDYEAAGGPQNEIYLNPNQQVAVVFDVPDVNEIQVSLRSVDGKPVTVSTVNDGKEITSSTEMYYTLTKSEGGAFTIINTGSGILGIGNIKVPGDTDEAAILTASQLDDEVVSYSIRMALAVEPDQPVEEEPAVFEPASFDYSCRSVNVLGRKLVTVSVAASNDVAYITVNGQKVNPWNNGLSWIYQPSTLRFTFTDLLKRGESKTYEIVAYNADGVASAVYTVQG